MFGSFTFDPPLMKGTGKSILYASVSDSYNYDTRAVSRNAKRRYAA